jgi:hypothetical protein
MGTVDDDLKELVRTSVQQALAQGSDDVSSALAEFGWAELAAADEAFAFTTLFEEQGRQAADTDALDVVTMAMLGLEVSGSVIWPVGRAPEKGASEGMSVHGVALRSIADAGRTIFVPVGGTLHVLAPSSIEESELGGMASGSRWVRVQAKGDGVFFQGSWPEIERRCRLAIGSELVGLCQRIIDSAVEHVSARRQFGRPIGTYQAVRHRLAEAYAEMVGAQALIAAAWEDGSPDAALVAKAVAGTAHDVVSKQAIQVCGAIGLSEEHELPSLVRRGFALDALLGSSRPVPSKFGLRLLAGERLEPVGQF